MYQEAQKINKTFFFNEELYNRLGIAAIDYELSVDIKLMLNLLGKQSTSSRYSFCLDCVPWLDPNSPTFIKNRYSLPTITKQQMQWGEREYWRPELMQAKTVPQCGKKNHCVDARWAWSEYSSWNPKYSRGLPARLRRSSSRGGVFHWFDINISRTALNWQHGKEDSAKSDLLAERVYEAFAGTDKMELAALYIKALKQFDIVHLLWKHFGSRLKTHILDFMSTYRKLSPL